MPGYFVTATGTDIGKTFVTCGLLRAHRAQGRAVAAFKPVVSGFDAEAPQGSDTALLLEAQARAVTPDTIAAISPWRFTAPLSPDMAAAREDRAIVFEELVSFSRTALARHSEATTLIEGVGGVMVPLDARLTVLDWMAALGLPLILVTGSYLGTLSHTFTALEAMRGRGLALAALVISESAGSTVTLEDTRASIARFAPAMPIATIPRGGNTTAAFASLAALLQAAI